ncbi:hypothetical protein COOONC_24838 [Cooperia oncophora]
MVVLLTMCDPCCKEVINVSRCVYIQSVRKGQTYGRILFWPDSDESTRKSATCIVIYGSGEKEGSTYQRPETTAWILKVPEPEWEIYLRETADLMIKKQNNEEHPRSKYWVRERLYELISRCIQPNLIFSYLLRELLKRTPSSARREVIEMAALYEHRLTRGQKAIIHLEAFVVAFMDIYLNSINSNAVET